MPKSPQGSGRASSTRASGEHVWKKATCLFRIGSADETGLVLARSPKIRYSDVGCSRGPAGYKGGAVVMDVGQERHDLEREGLRLANKKLDVEIEKLAKEMQPEKWWSRVARHIVTFGAVITIVGSAAGIYLSYSKTLDDRESARVADQRVRLEDAVKRIEAGNTIGRLAAVSVLSSYLSGGDDSFHRQVLFALASLVSVEADIQVQDAV